MSYEVSAEDGDSARRKLRIFEQYGGVESVVIQGNLDVDRLIDDSFEGKLKSEQKTNDEVDVDSPEDIVDLAESRGIAPTVLAKTAAERIDGMLVRLPSREEVGVEDVPETVILEHLTETLQGLSDEVESAERESATQGTQTPAPIPQSSQRGSEAAQIDIRESGGHSGSSRKGIEVSDRVDNGERKQQSIDFLKEHEGEWVNSRQFAEWAGIDAEDETREISIASAALNRVVENDYLEDIESRMVSNSARRGRWKEYKYSPSRQDDENEATYEEIPGRVKKGTQQHQALALLTHLVEKKGEGQTIDDLADIGRLEKYQFSTALTALKEKSLVYREDPDDNPQDPGEWYPRKAGEAELERLGGFQINSSS